MSEYSFPSFLKIRDTFAFLQPSDISPSHHNNNSQLSQHSCAFPKGLQTPALVFSNQSLFHQGYVFLVPVLSLASIVWSSLRLILPSKTEAIKAFIPQPFTCSVSPGPVSHLVTPLSSVSPQSHSVCEKNCSVLSLGVQPIEIHPQ